MPIFVNYAVPSRNPRRLLAACGMAPPSSERGEAVFLRRLRNVPPSGLNPLFLVMGGFMDGLKGYARGIAENLPHDLASRCDVFYREHDEARCARDIIKLYARQGKKMILAGHSWGASSLVLDAVAHERVPVALLVTLDPVDWRNPPAALPHVARWVNIYVNYAEAPWADKGNMAARIGRAWEALPCADVNRVYSVRKHSRALDMFREGALDEMRRTLG